MGKKNKKKRSRSEEDKENHSLRRRIRRLEEDLRRNKENYRKHSTSRHSSKSSRSTQASRRSRSRHSSRRSASQITSRQQLSPREPPYWQDRHRSPSRETRQRSRDAYASDRRSRSKQRSHSGRRSDAARRSDSRGRAQSPRRSRSRRRSYSRRRSRSERRSYSRRRSRSKRRSYSRRRSRSGRRLQVRDRSTSRSRQNESQERDTVPNNQENIQEKIDEISQDRVIEKELTISQAAENLDEKEKTIPEHEVELQEEVLSVLGSRLQSEKKTDTAIHKDVALRWEEIIKRGLPMEEVKALIEKFPIPDNCPFIAIPKLNAEINASVQDNIIKRDKRIIEKQERVAACLAAVGKAISVTLKMNSPQQIGLLELLSDGGRLLASIHREESLSRKNLILANLNSSLKATLTNTEVDEWLFGNDLEEKIKTAKNLEKTSKELKPPARPLQQSNAQKKTKNARGPPNQSTYKKQKTTSSGQRQFSSKTSDSKKPFYRRDASRYQSKRR